MTIATIVCIYIAFILYIIGLFKHSKKLSIFTAIAVTVAIALVCIWGIMRNFDPHSVILETGYIF